MTLVPSTTMPLAMDSFFQAKTAVFSKKVSADVLLDWRAHGGKLFYETERRKDERPDYYFTCSNHTNFYHHEGAMVLSVEWIADSLDAQRHVPCKFYIVNGITPPSSPWVSLPSLKSVFGKVFRTPKRAAEDDETAAESRKKQIIKKIGDLEKSLVVLGEPQTDRVGGKEDEVARRGATNVPTGQEWVEMLEGSSPPSSQTTSPSHPRQRSNPVSEDEMEEGSYVGYETALSGGGGGLNVESDEDLPVRDDTPFSIVDVKSDEMEVEAPVCDENLSDVEPPSEPDTPFSHLDYLSDWCDESDDAINTEDIFKYRSSKKGVKTFGDDDETDWKHEDFLRRTIDSDSLGEEEPEEGDEVVLAKFVDVAEDPKSQQYRHLDGDNGPHAKELITSSQIDREIGALPWDEAGTQMYESESPFPPRMFQEIAKGSSPLSQHLPFSAMSPEAWSWRSRSQSHDPPPSLAGSNPSFRYSTVSPAPSSLSPMRDETSQTSQGDTPPGKSVLPDGHSWTHSSAETTVQMKDSQHSTVPNFDSPFASPRIFVRSGAPPPSSRLSLSNKEAPPLPYITTLMEELAALNATPWTAPPVPPRIPKFTSAPPDFTSQLRSFSVPAHFSPGSAKRFTAFHHSVRRAFPALPFHSDRARALSESTLPLKSQSPSPATEMSPLDLGSPLLGSPSPPPTYPIALFSENVTPRSPARTGRLERELGLTSKRIQNTYSKRRRVAPPKFCRDRVRGTVSGKKSRVWEVQVKEATDKELLLQKRGDPVIGFPVFD